MRARDISFNVPEVRMRRIQVGCTLRTVVTGKFPNYRYRTWCQPNYIDVPTVEMVPKRFSTNVPQVTMRLQRMGLSVPESRVSMQTISWNFPEYVPHCTTNPNACQAEQREAQEQAKDLEARLGEVVTRTRRAGAEDAAKHVTTFFAYQRSTLQRQLNAMGEVLTTSVRQMESSLNLMAAQGAQNTPEAEETRAALAQIQSTLPAEIEKLRAAIAELSVQEAAIISGLSDAPAN